MEGELILSQLLVVVEGEHKGMCGTVVGWTSQNGSKTGRTGGIFGTVALQLAADNGLHGKDGWWNFKLQKLRVFPADGPQGTRDPEDPKFLAVHASPPQAAS